MNKSNYLIITRCPLRIGIAGGSTDLDSFINKFGIGSVISFPVNLYTYVTFHKDIIGYNAYYGKYIVNYTVREEVDNISDIKNDVVRHVLEYFNIDPSVVSLTSDIFSSGSGLASSSSYTISLIKAIQESLDINSSNFEVSKLAYDIEKRYNVLLGKQDTYGCGVGGLKRMRFSRGENISIEYLNSSIFNSFSMYLLYTGVSRSSTEVLKTVSHQDTSLLNIVEEMEKAIQSKDLEAFMFLIKRGWEEKKKTSTEIASNSTIVELDEKLNRDSRILAHRLCGAGNGGFFLLFSNQPLDGYKHCRKISIDNTGVCLIKQ